MAGPVIQTTYLGLVVAASGHRFVMQCGISDFKNTTETTLTIHFNKLVSAQFTPNQTCTSTKTAAVKTYMPWVDSAQYTGTIGAGRKIIVSKGLAGGGGGMAALQFSYLFIGY